MYNFGYKTLHRLQIITDNLIISNVKKQYKYSEQQGILRDFLIKHIIALALSASEVNLLIRKYIQRPHQFFVGNSSLYLLLYQNTTMFKGKILLTSCSQLL
jgi:hypothetical protein